MSKKCKLCDGRYFGYGHSAEPVSKGRCCNACKWITVIPEQLKQEANKNEV